MNQYLKQFLISICAAGILFGLLLWGLVMMSKTATGQIAAEPPALDAYVTKNYCLTNNLDKTDADLCKEKYYKAVVRQTVNDKLGYVELDLFERFEAGTLSTKNVDPNCRRDCVQTLEIYDVIDQMNRYMHENEVYFINTESQADNIKLLIEKIKLDKEAYTLSIKEVTK